MKKYVSNRYHAQIYYPDNFIDMYEEFVNTFKKDIDITYHASEQLLEDKRGIIPYPTKNELLDPKNKIVEFHERIDKPGRIQKAIIRIENLNEKFDYCYVVARDGVIVTAWTNDKGDNHRLTTSREKYIKNPR